MTGARVPENTSAIIPIEDIQELNDNKIKIIQNAKEFQHIRYIGEDIKKNDILINIGEEINFSKITLLSSQGISHIKVFKKPKIVVYVDGPFYVDNSLTKKEKSNTLAKIVRDKMIERSKMSNVEYVIYKKKDN